MSIVLKEMKETRYWLRLIQRTEMSAPISMEPILDKCKQLCAIIGKSISTAKKKKRQ
jgi:four helix bundle protein